MDFYTIIQTIFIEKNGGKLYDLMKDEADVEGLKVDGIVYEGSWAFKDEKRNKT